MKKIYQSDCGLYSTSDPRKGWLSVENGVKIGTVRCIEDKLYYAFAIERGLFPRYMYLFLDKAEVYWEPVQEEPSYGVDTKSSAT